MASALKIYGRWAKSWHRAGGVKGGPRPYLRLRTRMVLSSTLPYFCFSLCHRTECIEAICHVASSIEYVVIMQDVRRKSPSLFSRFNAGSDDIEVPSTMDLSSTMQSMRPFDSMDNNASI